jgi:radical SAM superfamily enzyme YgiQ (UPF0313 family)
MKKNFLFIVPRFSSKGCYYPFPYGLAYVIAALKQKDFNVSVLNLCEHLEPIEALISEKIQEDSVDVVCTGAMSLHWDKVKEVLDIVKKINQGIITVVGGPIITSDPELALTNLSVDYGVIGEGEETIVELADALSNNKETSDVPGIAYMDGSVVLFSAARPPIQDIDKLPLPDYDSLGFKNWLDVCQERAVDIFASRSCPYACTFCYHPLGNKYRQRSLDSVFKEIETIQDRYNIFNFNFQDELFSYDKERVLEFAARIKKLNIRYFIQWRVDNIDLEMLQALKDSGVRCLELGVESYSDTVLRSMKKGITKKQIQYAYELCDAAGVNVTSNIIIGDPAETEETVQESLEFVQQHPDHVINIGFILAIPDSVLWRQALAKGLIRDKLGFIRKGFPVINMTGMSNRVFNRIRKRIMVYNIIKNTHGVSLVLFFKIVCILLLSNDGFLFVYNLKKKITGHLT